MFNKIFVSLISLAVSFTVYADTTAISSQRLNDNVHVLFGQGGNIAVIDGGQQVYVVDTQFADAYTSIKAEIAKIVPNKTVRYVINTHGHNDHTNGNGSFKADGTTLIAHQNVPAILQAQNSDGKNYPDMTFAKEMQLMTDNGVIPLTHFANAHTNSDIIVQLPQANVIHAGDILFFGRFPFIDVKNGGTIDGMIEGINGILERSDDKTKIIAGHGNVTDKKGLTAHRDMLVTVKERVQDLKAQGKSLDDIKAAKPSREWDATHNWNFINTDKFITSVYQSLP